MKIIGILLALVVVAVAFIFAFRKSEEAPDTAGSAGVTTLGAPPPTDVSRNAKSAAEYTKRQTCLADCASEERTCKATSLADESPCIQARTACEGRCP